MDIMINTYEKIYTDNPSCTYDVGQNGFLKLFIYTIDQSGDIIINLKEENAQVELHLSILNYNDNKLNITINHLQNKTISNIYNHGVNVDNNKLTFNINGVVPKNIEGCIVNEENQIINLKNGIGKINPNLLIENYNVDSSHSAYIGTFKEDSIFYLSSRGISRDKCIKLLMKSNLQNGGDSKEKIVSDFINRILEV